jgi:drug/metabolite transporter (DMT)-like permease
MVQDRPTLGIALMVGFCIIAPVGDAIAKLLSTSVPLVEVVLVRFGVQAMVLVPLVLWSGKSWNLRRSTFALTLLRTVLHITGIAAMFTALRYLPLADAVAIAFVMPFFMLILGKFILKEVVGSRRLGACIVGFAGTLLIVQPSFLTVGWPALLPVFVAANFSVFMLLTRQIAKDIDPISLQAVSGVMAVVLITPLIGLGQIWGSPDFAMILPDVDRHAAACDRPARNAGPPTAELVLALRLLHHLGPDAISRDSVRHASGAAGFW